MTEILKLGTLSVRPSSVQKIHDFLVKKLTLAEIRKFRDSLWEDPYYVTNRSLEKGRIVVLAQKMIKKF